MTTPGDMCLCGDIAVPGRDVCAGCLADVLDERQLVSQEARRLTDAHEAELEEQVA